jgi:hypothetical protein
LNDVLRLELRLPGPPPDDAVRPLLENDVRRDGGPDSPSVAATLLVGEKDLGIMVAVALPKTSWGISAATAQSIPVGADVKMQHTSVDRVGLSVVSYVWCFGFGDLHLTIFLCFRESQILFVPLQTAIPSQRWISAWFLICAYCCCPDTPFGGAFLRMPFGLEFERDIGGWWECSGISFEDMAEE